MLNYFNIFKHTFIIAIIGTTLIGSVTFPPSAQADSVITVATNVDTIASDGLCSLREAIINANNDAQTHNDCVVGSGNDTIQFNDALGSTTITLGSTLPDITDTDGLTINGGGDVTIDGNNSYRIIILLGNVPLTLNQITLTQANSGGLGTGGAIYNAGALIVTNSVFTNNAGGVGGAIANAENTGTLTITNSVFSGNSAAQLGGSIYSAQTSTITNSIFLNNTATSGASGGAIFVIGGTLTVTNSTFSGNSAASSGGGIASQGTLTVTNSTFSGNSASTGGGIFNSGTLHLKNTILANSITGVDCYNAGGNTIATNANNLIETNAASGNMCGTPTLTSDPALNLLADNGGPTQTFSLQTSSPAINAGTNTGCPATDQRGVPRPQSVICDIGAYESNAQPGPTFVVNTNEDSDDGFCDAYIADITDCTLREAITSANNSGTDTITFADDYTITLSNQLPTVISTIIINGNGVGNTIIQGNAAPNIATRRIFFVNSGAGNLTLNDVTVRHGVCNGLCESAGGVGGGIYVVGGILAINNSLISANAAIDGGGGLNTNSGLITITNSTFSDNSSPNAGGAITNTGSMTISNSTITSNLASGGGYAGGIRNIGTLDIYNSTISGNTANSGVFDGANIVQESVSSTLNLYNTILANGINDGDCGIYGGTISATNTLIESTGSLACNLTNVNGNIIGSDPNLGLLTGSPGYFPLNTGSPAINAGNNTICAASPVNNESQNGVTRPNGANCDIGSVEKLVTATFADVPTNAFGWAYIESIYFAGITGGCTTFPLNYCPNNSVTRASMAIFLLRGIHSSSYTPPAATGTVFNDVPLGSFGDAWIEQFVAEGITAGCGGSNYCPSAPVTRASMAIFLLRAKYGSGYTPPAATGTDFTDVPLGSFADAWIEQLVAEGITGGCGGGNYCPNAPVTRSQMAIFIQRTFSLALP